MCEVIGTVSEDCHAMRARDTHVNASTCIPVTTGHTVCNGTTATKDVGGDADGFDREAENDVSAINMVGWLRAKSTVAGLNAEVLAEEVFSESAAAKAVVPERAMPGQFAAAEEAQCKAGAEARATGIKWSNDWLAVFAAFGIVGRTCESAGSQRNGEDE